MNQNDAKRPRRFYIRPMGLDAKTLEDAIVEWIDKIRIEAGLPPLEDDDDDETDGGDSDDN